MRLRRATGLAVICLSVVTFAYKALAGATAYVSDDSSSSKNSTSFLAALQDQSVSEIILLTDYSVGDTFQPFVPATGKDQRSPVPINRNVTVTGADGVNTILNLEFVRSAVEVCSSCILRFYNITVENERRGPTGAVDFVLGQPGSRLLFEDAIRLRPACTTAQDSAQVAKPRNRSQYWPAVDAPQQQKFVNITFRGVEYTDMMLLVDQSADFPRTVQEGRGPADGVAVRHINTTRICRYTVDPACLKEKSSETCVNMLVDEVLARESLAARGPQQHMAAVVISVVLGALALGAVVAGARLVRARKRKARYQQQQQQQHLDSESTYGPFSANSEGGSKDGGTMSDMEKGSSRKLVRAALGTSKGWALSRVITPLLQVDEAANKVELGDLLGAGSFGRVYHGMWAGREVAVKVIEHDSSTSKAVENEVELMMDFNHPNIVRAFHCLTYQRVGSTTISASLAHSAGGSAGSTPRSMGSSPLPDATGSAPGESFTREDVSSSATSEYRCEVQRAADSSASILQPMSSQIAPRRLTASQLAGSSSPATTFDAPTSDDSAREAAATFGSPRGTLSAIHEPGVSVEASSCCPDVGADNTAIDKGTECQGSCGGSGNVTGGTHPSTRHHTQRVETWIVQEYCDQGTLGNVAKGWNTADESDVQMLNRLLLLKDAAQGLQVLHNAKVVHGDLNARNVLVSSSHKNPNGMEAKLGDFGLSKAMKQNKTHRTTNTIGTMSHMPPELLRYGRMSPAVDVYAFGIMMWELYSGQVAFRKLHYGQFFETVVLRNLRPLVPPGMPADYQLLMEHCWATEPGNRPPIDRLIECLRYMIIERQRNLRAADDPSIHGPAMPHLLSMPAPERHSWTSCKAGPGQASTAAAAADPDGSQTGYVSPPKSPAQRDAPGAAAVGSMSRGSFRQQGGSVPAQVCDQRPSFLQDKDVEAGLGGSNDNQQVREASGGRGGTGMPCGVMQQQQLLLPPLAQSSIDCVDNPNNWFV